jgi:hypothetical protein
MCTPEWANLFLQGGPEGPAVHDLPTPAAAEHRLAIATGISRRLVAARFKVSADAAWRHGREHLTPEIRAALATKVLAREGDLHRILLEEGSGVVGTLASEGYSRPPAVTRAVPQHRALTPRSRRLFGEVVSQATLPPRRLI